MIKPCKLFVLVLGACWGCSGDPPEVVTRPGVLSPATTDVDRVLVFRVPGWLEDGCAPEVGHLPLARAEVWVGHAVEGPRRVEQRLRLALPVPALGDTVIQVALSVMSHEYVRVRLVDTAGNSGCWSAQLGPDRAPVDLDPRDRPGVN